jgi:hypothetical protein
VVIIKRFELSFEVQTGSVVGEGLDQSVEIDFVVSGKDNSGSMTSRF